MTTVYAFLATGFEEVECLATADLLVRAGVEVKLISIGENLMVTGSHGFQIMADACYSQVRCDEADVLFLPGGMPGTKNLSEFAPLCKALSEHHRRGGRLAAICAAPRLLGMLGILEGKQATCYPGNEEQLLGARCVRQGVVTDGNVTTARGLGYALDLGIELIRLLVDEDTAMKVKASIQYDQC